MEGLFARVLLEEQWDCLLPEWLRLVKVVELMTLLIPLKPSERPLARMFYEAAQGRPSLCPLVVEKCEEIYYISLSSGLFASPNHFR
jgi:hypothetical protein